MSTNGARVNSWLAELKAFREQWNANSPEYWGENAFSRFVLVSKGEKWQDFVDWHESLIGDWGFRGQREADWSIDSSLDRAVRVRGETEYSSFFQHLDREATERELLFRFRQQAHRYLKHLPQETDLISWLALMQHHGTPTRLLDWTRSPHVAAYFAFESQLKTQCAVWAVNLDWLRRRANELLQSHGKSKIPEPLAERANYLNLLLGESEKQDEPPERRAMIVEVEPARIDAWMTSQQGFFLSKVYWKASFADMLVTMMMHPQLIEEPTVRKLEVTESCRFEFLQKLRVMNIHRGSLFPDLDGFARSLEMDWQIKKEAIRQGMRNVVEPPLDDNNPDFAEG